MRTRYAAFLVVALGGVVCLAALAMPVQEGANPDRADAGVPMAEVSLERKVVVGRILHEDDLGRGTRSIERPLQGEKPILLDDEVLLIPVPGHTKGSTCLLYRGKFLFTGDHLAWSASLGHVYAFRSACWYSWSKLIASTERLAEYSFEWILPGHGRRCAFPRDEMARQMGKAVDWMKKKG